MSSPTPTSTPTGCVASLNNLSDWNEYSAYKQVCRCPRKKDKGRTFVVEKALDDCVEGCVVDLGSSCQRETARAVFLSQVKDCCGECNGETRTVKKNRSRRTACMFCGFEVVWVRNRRIQYACMCNDGRKKRVSIKMKASQRSCLESELNNSVGQKCSSKSNSDVKNKQREACEQCGGTYDSDSNRCS